MENTLEIHLSRGQVAVIDASDYPVVSAFRWYATPSTVANRYYAAARVRTADGRPTTVYMHRLIVGAPKGKEVDHLNHDTLDNRRANLRVGSHRDNMQNGKFALTTHCPKGHAYDEANTYINAKGKRFCRACNRIRVAAVYAAETPEQTAQRRSRNMEHYRKNRERYLAKFRERSERMNGSK
jgi:hypothetical protein